MSDDLDRAVRTHVYAELVERGKAPAVADTARSLAVRADQVVAALDRLAAAHALYLTPGTGDVHFAAPFSAVPTQHTVRADGRSYFAPCAWDALGIPAALGMDAEIDSTCPDCGDAIALTVRDGSVSGNAATVHFGVPARRWWDDLAFT